jgi:hypothetical protein
MLCSVGYAREHESAFGVGVGYDVRDSSAGQRDFYTLIYRQARGKHHLAADGPALALAAERFKRFQETRGEDDHDEQRGSNQSRLFSHGGPPVAGNSLSAESALYIRALIYPIGLYFFITACLFNFIPAPV